MKNNTFVLDVNIWITCFYNKQPDYISELVKKFGITIYRSPVLTDELERVLHYKKLAKKIVLSKEFYMDIYFDSTHNIVTFPIFTDCPDPKDNYLFDLAIQAQADYLVSGDDDVLNTSVSPPLQIISFTQFRNLF